MNRKPFRYSVALSEIPFHVTALLPDGSTKPVQSFPSSNAVLSTTCTLPNPGLRWEFLERHYLFFVLLPLICSLMLCHCGPQHHGIHYPSGISAVTETEHVIKNSSTFITFLFAWTTHYAAHSHTFTFFFSVRSTNPSIFTSSAAEWICDFI